MADLEKSRVEVGIANLDEAPSIAALRAVFFEDQLAKGMLETPPSCEPEAVARLIGRPRQHMLRARREGRVLAYLFGQTKIAPGAQGGAVSSIEEIFVAEDARRLGLARTLVDHAIRQFRAEGAERIQLRVLSPNAEGAAFWQSIGFSPYVTTYELQP